MCSLATRGRVGSKTGHVWTGLASFAIDLRSLPSIRITNHTRTQSFDSRGVTFSGVYTLYQNTATVHRDLARVTNHSSNEKIRNLVNGHHRDALSGAHIVLITKTRAMRENRTCHYSRPSSSTSAGTSRPLLRRGIGEILKSFRTFALWYSHRCSIG